MPIKFHDGYNSPGNFLRHNWDLIQDCLNANTDDDKWVEDNALPGYKSPMTSSLVQLNDPNFEIFDPCESLANDFKRPPGV